MLCGKLHCQKVLNAESFHVRFIPGGNKIYGNVHNRNNICIPALEATQGQIDGFSSQLPYKCYLEAVASVGD